MLKNMVEPEGPQISVWGMRIAYRITKVTDTNSEYVIFFFHGNNCRKQVSQCYVMRILLVLFFLILYCNKTLCHTLNKLYKYWIFSIKLLILNVYSISIFDNFQLTVDVMLMYFAKKKKEYHFSIPVIKPRKPSATDYLAWDIFIFSVYPNANLDVVPKYTTTRTAQFLC